MLAGVHQLCIVALRAIQPNHAVTALLGALRHFN